MPSPTRAWRTCGWRATAKTRPTPASWCCSAAGPSPARVASWPVTLWLWSAPGCRHKVEREPNHSLDADGSGFQAVRPVQCEKHLEKSHQWFWNDEERYKVVFTNALRPVSELTMSDTSPPFAFLACSTSNGRVCKNTACCDVTRCRYLDKCLFCPVVPPLGLVIIIIPFHTSMEVMPSSPSRDLNILFYPFVWVEAGLEESWMKSTNLKMGFVYVLHK